MAQITLNSSGVASDGALALQSNGTTTAVTINTSQNVGIGTISPGFRLDVAGGSSRIIPSGGSANSHESAAGTLNVYGATSSITTRTGALRLESYSDMAINAGTGIAFSGRLNTAPNDSSYTFAKIGGYKENATTGNASGYLAFATTTGAGDLTERARITSGGIVFVGKQATSLNTAGIELNQSGEALLTVSSNPIIYCNRKDSDGTLIEFRQDGATEGTISVSGTTVSYNGGHLSRWSQLLNNQRDESILKGTVLSNLNEMCEWTDTEGNTLSNEQLNRMKLSDVEGDTNVAGVFVNWDNDDKDNPYDMNIAMTGDMIIRIAQGTTVQRGDLLMSAGDGTAKPQGDDIVRSKTVAKVTSTHVTCTYADGSYCVPCVLMAC